MINNLRRYPKIVLGIFTVCCIMFVGEYYIKSLFNSRPTEKKYTSMPNVVTINNKDTLKFEEYADKISEWENTIGSMYKKYGIDENSNLYISTANRYVINSFIENTIFKKLADELNISVYDDEKYEILYGNNLDEEIKSTFINDKKDFDKNKYLEFLKSTETNSMLKSYWLKQEKNIIGKRVNKKIKTLLEGLSMQNSLQIKRKWEEENNSYNIKYAYKDADVYKKDNTVFNNKMKEYYENNKENFKENESFKIKYIIKNVEITEDIKKEALSKIMPIVKKFKICRNPEEFAKAKSDNIDKKKSIKYSKKVRYSNLPKCLKSKELITINSIGIKFPDIISKPIKIYKIISIENDKNEKKYNIAILYKNIFVDENLKNNLFDNIENEIQNINNLEEFEEFANENDTEIKDLDLNTKTTNVEGVDNINILKKNIYSPSFKKVENSFLPITKTKNGYFIGYLYKHINKDSLKEFKDVKNKIEKKVSKQLNKEYNENIIKNDKNLKNSIDKYSNDKLFISGNINNFKIKDVDKINEDNAKSLKKILKNINLFSNSETEFFYKDKKIIKLDIIKEKGDEFDIENEKIKTYIKENRNSDKKDKTNYTNIFKDIYKVEKIDYAYFIK